MQIIASSRAKKEVANVRLEKLMIKEDQREIFTFSTYYLGLIKDHPRLLHMVNQA
jgi:hypothetical protein